MKNGTRRRYLKKIKTIYILTTKKPLFFIGFSLLLVVILPDSSVSEVGYCDGYGRVEMCNSEQVYECDSKDGIAISNSIYKLMKDDSRFKTLIESKSLFPFKSFSEFIN